MTTATQTEIIARYADADAGIEAVVARIDRGFSVAVRDTDADLYVGAALIFPTFERADAAARQAVA